MLDWELHGVGLRISQVSHNPELRPIRSTYAPLSYVLKVTTNYRVHMNNERYRISWVDRDLGNQAAGNI
jgi:hypothetical protein